MFSHVSLGTTDAGRAAAFYDPVLAVLGIGKGKARGGSVDYGSAMIGFSLDPEDDRVRALTVRRRAAIKFFVHEGAVHILGISYRGRDLAAFFEGRQP